MSQKNYPIISVIIPTYNRAFFIKEAIQSVLDQDYFSKTFFPDSLDLWIIDDGSTDNTQKIVEEFGERVNYYFQENSGVSSARNQGLRFSRGDYIAFLDSDDQWKKNKICRQLEFLENHRDAMLCCTEEIWIRKGKFVNPKKKHKKYSGWIFDKVLPLCLLSLSSALFRRRVFDELGFFDEELPACEDYDLGIRIAQKYPLFFLPEPLIIKKGGHSDQLSKKYWGMDRFRVYALEKALQTDLLPKQRELVKQEIMKKSKILVNGFKKRGKYDEAKKYEQLIQDLNK